jgi:hypothetical protein
MFALLRRCGVKAHNILIICIGALLLNAATVFADTIPEGNVSGTWYAANSPYLMMYVSEYHHGDE